MFADFEQALVSQRHAAGAFETERLCHDSDGEDSHLLRGACNDRRCAGSGAATHASGDEDHVGAFEIHLDLVDRFFGCFRADIRAGTSAKA